MNTRILVILSVVLAFALALTSFPNGGIAALVAAGAAMLVVRTIRSAMEIDDAEKEFLVQIFLIGLLPRALLAAIIFGFNLETIFGPDAVEYHRSGKVVAEQWWFDLTRSLGGMQSGRNTAATVLAGGASNWGMSIFVSVLYFLFGPNPLVVQLLSCVCGAATAPVLYFCADSIFKNKKVARISAILIALFPAMIIWSSQGMKDGFIVFFLVFGMLAILRLQKTFSYFNIAVLLAVMLGVFTFRFYLFPLLGFAAIGGFLVGSQTSFKDVFNRVAILLVIGISLSVLGVTRQSQTQMQESGDLNTVEYVRRGGNIAGESRYNTGANVSTISGALQALPNGAAHLFAAPFPWQMQKTTQLLLLPEMMLWWLSLPLTAIGLWYVVRKRFRENVSILLFVITLSISYSLFQGNLGTMYRQRTQIQVFLFMFTAVGIALHLEKREVAKLIRERQRRF